MRFSWWLAKCRVYISGGVHYVWQASKLIFVSMMTSWNGNIFCVTVPLWGNPSATGGFPCLVCAWNSKQSRCWWLETPWRSLWLHCNGLKIRGRCAHGDQSAHGDVIKWKHFPRNWPFVRGIHRSPVNSPHKGQWRGDLMFSLICTRINGWVNDREAGDLRRYHAHYDVIVMN